MAETQLKLAEAEKNIYWLTFVRSPGRGSSVCRHSWISDLPASVSVSFSLSFCVCLYLSLSPTTVAFTSLLTSCWPHFLSLQKAQGKVAMSPWPMVWFCFCFLLRIPEEKGGSPSLLIFGTHKIISKTQVEYVPPLNQSLWLAFE